MKTTTNTIEETRSFMSYSYGNSAQQRAYSLRVQKALLKAGVPDVSREKKIYYNDLSTAQWQVSFPAEYRETVRRVTDAMYTKQERDLIRANSKRIRQSLEAQRRASSVRAQ